MRSGREQEIDHLYRRAGFGASQEEVEALHEPVVCQLRRRGGPPAELLGNPRRCGQLDRPTGLCRCDRPKRQRISAGDQHPRCPAALAVPDGAHEAPAAGEDGAVLAQPLRHGLHEGRQRHWRRRLRDAHARGQARRGCQPDEGPARALSRVRARKFSRPAHRGRQGSGDARVARRPHERPRPAAGELRARADGALHDGRRRASRRPTCTPARACSPDGIWPWPTATRAQARYEFFYNAAQHDTAAKEFSFPIYADGRRTIPARSAGEGMQDGIDFINAVARHPDTGPRLARKLYAYFVNEVDAPDERLIEALARVYYTSNYEIAADGAAAAALGAVQGSIELLQAVFLACRVRRAFVERSRVERVLREQRAQPAHQHGAAAVRAARRQRLGARRRAGSRAAACWRG